MADSSDFFVVLAALSFSCYSTSFVPAIVNLLIRRISGENEKCRELRQSIKRLTDEIYHISAVDEFARYTRKNRELTKLRDELKSSDSADTVKLIKFRLACTVLCYIIAIYVVFHTLYKYHGVVLLNFPSNWFFPLNRVMAWPGLTVKEDESPVGVYFVFIMVYYLSRFTTVLNPWT